MAGESKYHEQVHRHAAVMPDGRPCEILERVTFERTVGPDGSLSEAREVNRRFDLKTGERVNHIAGDEFQLDLEGVTLRRLGVKL